MATETGGAGGGGGGRSDPAAAATAPRLPMPSRNPLPLSASQEAQVRDVFYERVRSKCGPEIKAFADCALHRTFTAPFACRAPHRIMNSCMKTHATQEEHDAAREEWFALRMQRAKERERKALRKAEQEAFLREWWGLPEKDREQAKREWEKLKRGERIGGGYDRVSSGGGAAAGGAAGGSLEGGKGGDGGR
ncbi:uncharacterized protein C8A04DRAFT_38752 [Dichotomopilus funicola]|uniref:COX assembly mitochondrial protein n=1 Tax=Dichotomopilus funicola TaxID=1934379 RepID=A0AAN6UZ08_9PEZI|nr:hypothetical protein C8A04DRAFT_38752 [Dichotomopilus funicola]